MPVEFLQISDVLQIHHNQIAEYGGEYGIRDIGLLESAVSQPEAGVNGEYLHCDIFFMAAAYLFHIINNHPYSYRRNRQGCHSRFFPRKY